MTVGQYNSAGITLTDKQVAKPQLDSSGNMKVVVSGASSGTAGDVASGSADSGNPVKIGGVVDTSNGWASLTNGARQNVKMSTFGEVAVNLYAGGFTAMGSGAQADTASNSQSRVFAEARDMVFNGTTWDRLRGSTSGLFNVPQAVTSGGLSISRLIGATSGVIKASAGQLYTATLTNTNAAIRFLQIYNKTTAGTLSTDTPLLTIPLPPNASVMIDFSAIGGAFSTGISWQFTTDDVAIPTTAGASTDIHGFVTYK